MPKILLVEDDVEFSLVLVNLLTEQQYVVEHVLTGADADARLGHCCYDVIILDWQLPDSSGPRICRNARQKGIETPILMLTGMSAKENKVQGLDDGADDYLTKPFDTGELFARLRSLVRRASKSKQLNLTAGPLRIDPQSHRVYLFEKEVQLSKTEFALLEFLLRNKGQIFDADALLDRVWSSDSEVSRDLVKVYINKLRSKLKVEGEPPLIVTVHGVGYRLDSPD